MHFAQNIQRCTLLNLVCRKVFNPRRSPILSGIFACNRNDPVLMLELLHLIQALLALTTLQQVLLLLELQEDPIPAHCTLEVLVLQPVAFGYYYSHPNATTSCLGNRISNPM